MLTKPNTVFAAKQINTSGAGLAYGDIVVINANTGAVVASSTITTLASAPTAIQLGFVKSDGSIAKTQVINRKNIKNINYDAYVAPVLASATVNFGSVTPVIGNRYVLRLIFRDIYEHPGQFTQSYEFIATTTDATDIATAITTAINAHKGARVTAVIAGDSIALTAKDVTANGFSTQGLEAITPYSQVQMKVVAYTTVPTSRYVSAYDAIPGISITVVESSPGKGNPYIVRDREQAALGYKGITYRTEFPIIKPTLDVDLTKTYDSMVIEFSNQYQSPDNQYVKSTDCASEVYVDHANTGTLSTLEGLIAAWGSLVGPTGATGGA